MIPSRVVERALTKVVMGPNGCHVSTYSVGSHGYGQVGWGEDRRIRMVTAPVAVMAPVPEGMTVDHICHNRRCVNRDHLRYVTLEENGRDGAFARWGVPLAERTHCRKGHEFAIVGRYTRPNGVQECHECIRQSSKRQAAKRNG